MTDLAFGLFFAWLLIVSIGLIVVAVLICGVVMDFFNYIRKQLKNVKKD